MFNRTKEVGVKEFKEEPFKETGAIETSINKINRKWWSAKNNGITSPNIETSLLITEFTQISRINILWEGIILLQYSLHRSNYPRSLSINHSCRKVAFKTNNETQIKLKSNLHPLHQLPHRNHLCYKTKPAEPNNHLSLSSHNKNSL